MSKNLSAYCRKKCSCVPKKGRSRICSCKAKRKKKCRFRVTCRKIKGENSLVIRSLNVHHKCGWQSKNTRVSSQYLADIYLEDWRDNSSWDLRAFQLKIGRDIGVDVSYHKRWLARRIASYMIGGDASEQYKKV